MIHLDDWQTQHAMDQQFNRAILPMIGTLLLLGVAGITSLVLLHERKPPHHVVNDRNGKLSP